MYKLFILFTVMNNKRYVTFLDNARKKHNNKFDYSLVNYINSKTNIKIICPIHGEFEQTPETHLSSNGCKSCSFELLAKNRSRGIDKFISESNIKYNNKFDYSLVNYVNNKTNVKIICPIHGEFEQIPEVHLNGKYGCFKCSIDEQRKVKVDSVDDFIVKARIVHRDKYDYSLVEYINAKSLVKIVCPEHGEFEQLPDNHLRKGYGCIKCSNCGVSSGENELIDYIKSIEEVVETSVNNIIYPKDIDVYIPSKKIGFEYNGLFWHSELYKDNNYHLNKTEDCEKVGVRLIHIFEDEWLYKNDIVKSRIRNILGLIDDRVYARKCKIREVGSSECRDFLDKNHIQGFVKSKVRVGLYYNDELVSLMSFGDLRKNMGLKGEECEYELLRFCNKLDLNVIGGASRLLKYFVKNYKPRKVISYADRRWSQGGVYETLGFEFVHDSRPNYWYIFGLNREYRYKYRKSELIKMGYDKDKSEREIMFGLKKYRVYDCGNKKYVMNI